MKMKDLRPGMVVAERASDRNPDTAPYRDVVLSTEYGEPGTRYGTRRHDSKPVDFVVTAEDTGQEVRASAHVSKYDPKVLVLRHLPDTTNTGREARTLFLTPGRIEGPYEEVSAQRAERRERRHQAARERAEAKAAQDARGVEIVLALEEAGVLASYDSRGTGSIVLTLGAAQALVAALQDEPLEEK